MSCMMWFGLLALAAPLPGDLDRDGAITVMDLHQWRSRRIDVNGDGLVNIFDVLTIRNRLGWRSMSCASRTSGVAPLAVVFDAVAVESGVVPPAGGDPADAHYAWQFGDPDSGVFATTGNLKTDASGYIAAHVYETPGTYPVRLTVTTPDGAVHTYEQTVTVTPFSGTSYYVSSRTGLDGHDGRTPATPFRTVARAASVMGSNCRVLFRRGDTWTTDAQILITADGPGIVGAYGSGPRPIIHCTSNTLFLGLRARDWRIVDLVLRGAGGDSVGIEGRQDRVGLCLRCEVTGFRVGLASSWIDPFAHSGNVYADCVAAENTVNNAYLAGDHLAIIGCDLRDAGGSHLLRIWHMRRGLISNSLLHNPGGNRHALKLHNEHRLNPPDAEHIVISDNDVQGDVWPVAIGPQDAGSDERIRYVLFERNVVRANSTTQALVCLWARDVTARNNMLIGTGSSRYLTGFAVGRRGVEPPPERVRIVNNTLYKGDDGSELTFARVEVGTDIEVRNNLMSAPRFTGSMRQMVQAFVPVAANPNLDISIDPFVDPGHEDFRLRPDTVPRDAGMTLPAVFDDVNGVSRPQNAAFDLGATEQ